MHTPKHGGADGMSHTTQEDSVSANPPRPMVTEEDIARMAGLDVQAVRDMLSGVTPIPEHLQGVIPAPAAQLTSFVWRPEDVVGIDQRIAEARARFQQQEAQEAALLAEAREKEDAQRKEEVDDFLRRREQERADAEDRFGTDTSADAALPFSNRQSRMGWWKTLVASWRTVFGRSDDGLAPTVSTSAQVAAELDSIRSAERTVGEENTVGEPADFVVSGSNTMRTRSSTREMDAPAPSARQQRREEKLLAKQAARAEREAAKRERIAAKAERKQSPIGIDHDPKRLNDPNDADLLSDAALSRSDKRALKSAERAARDEQAKAAKATKRLLSEREKAPKLSADEKKAKRAELRAEKRADKESSAQAKKSRDRAYKEAIERWKSDVKVAKANGTRPPRRPKRPKNDTSKPKSIDVTNAVRALATMLENSPGELDSIRVMAREYEGTQIGEAFRRIQLRVSDQNASLVEAFAPERVFPTEVHNMLAVGQKTIAPGPALRTAVKLMDAGNDARRKLRSEISEPVAVGLLSLVALFATAYGVMPSFVEMYKSLEMPVPPVSAAILVMSDVTVWVLGAAFALVLGYFIWYSVYGRTWDRWRTWLDTYALHMPLMGQANMTQQTYQLLKVLGAYINVGAPEREALVDASAATKNRAIKKHLLTTAELMMAGRRTFAGTFDSELFPSMAKNIIGIGEQAGRVPEALLDLETVYEREAEVATQQAVSRVSGTVAGVSSLIFTVVVTMVTVPPLEMFGSTLSYGQ